ncbi:recombination-associated protein RdgC [Spartinivicinus poritis]|uniref:Recombination-associated protein RdgC n=1 Tax=Spartinivicinus poritis TaxID=2994640 RepID=A0ABT5U7J3_9GAMM|nr:recombination-associated protein RdgC [Spartinivicinus sp. A2-2]MDE1462335.1 recombination-associated protein RdgC [Spartinivicinus sp. A2-2]
MWFKNLFIYRLSDDFSIDESKLEALLEQGIFKPCGKMQPFSLGWAAPLGKQGDQLAHISQGNYLLSLKKEERLLPAAVINEFVAEKVEAIEEEQSRKVTRKERESIKDDTIAELLPKAFTRSSHSFGFLSTAQKLLIINAGSSKKAEEFTSHLRHCLGSLPISPYTAKNNPADQMTAWLTLSESCPAGFTIGDECELREPTEDGGIIRCKQLDLTSNEVEGHLNTGKKVNKLALTWQDQIHFVLSDDLTVKRIKYTELLMEQSEDHEDKALQFDADFMLMSESLVSLIKDLTNALGGEDPSITKTGVAV